MTRSRTDPRHVAVLSAVAVATTWVALLSWRGFTEQPSRFLGPLLVLAVVVSGTGSLARWWRAPGPVVVLAQVVASALVTFSILCGSPLPVGAAWDRLVASFTDAADTANKFAPPVPLGVPGVHPLLIVGGLGCILLVEVLACTLRRVPLAGLPLLTVFSVPVSMLGTGMSWWIFALTAGGFLTMLFLHESEQVSRWGRSFDADPDTADPSAFGVQTGAVRVTAGAIGGVVTALAIVVPLVIPTLSIHLLDFGRGPGGDGDIVLENPMADMRRDLRRGIDVPLLTVTTQDPDPSYLRIAVLNRFNGDQWSSGDRDVPANNLARGDLPPLVGVNDTVVRQDFDYQIVATDQFRSTWLPTAAQISRIDAPGDWRYDTDTMDFLASDEDLDTAELAWTFNAVRLDLDADALARAGSPAALISGEFTELPLGIDSLVRNLAFEVTGEATSNFEKAVALQNWFRSGGGFEYDDRVNLGNGSDDLVRFLEDDEEGRTGYCEQFAAAMTVMAREIGIPARVAIGFLTPQRTGPDTYVYSAHDLHAWPELFFAGSGWVRFEPTPPGRASGVPDYTNEDITPDTALPTETGNEAIDEPGPTAPTAVPGDETPDTAAAGTASAVPWVPILGSLVLVLLLVGLALSPRLVRARRRERRFAGGPEDAWAELRDTVIDLGLAWPRDRSPRQTRDVLVSWFGAPLSEFTTELPRRGPAENADAVLAIDRIVHALERLRYARFDDPSIGTWHAEIGTCLEALAGGAVARARRWATWWPRSVFVRTLPTPPVTSDEDAGQPTYGRVVDHVGS